MFNYNNFFRNFLFFLSNLLLISLKSLFDVIDWVVSWFNLQFGLNFLSKFWGSVHLFLYIYFYRGWVTPLLHGLLLEGQNVMFSLIKFIHDFGVSLVVFDGNLLLLKSSSRLIIRWKLVLRGLRCILPLLISNHIFETLQLVYKILKLSFKFNDFPVLFNLNLLLFFLLLSLLALKL